jgi:hypothetical protein
VRETNCDQYYPGSIAAWDYDANQVMCVCPEGKTWNADRTACVDDINWLVAHTSCSYANSEPRWDPRTGQVLCFCLPGYAWNATGTACVPDHSWEVANADCSAYPGSEARWDEFSSRVVCDCPAGKVWNSSRTACVDAMAEIIGLIDDLIGTGSTGGENVGTVSHSNCNELKEAGTDAAETHIVNLGQGWGSFRFDYQTFTQKDRIEIWHGGTRVFDSGCTGTANWMNQQVMLSGFGTEIKVIVYPNCEGGTGTQWEFKVNCPGR